MQYDKMSKNNNLSALRAATKKLQAMTFDGEIGEGFDAGKLLFAETGVYLAHFAAGGTGDVVVMTTGVMEETETMRAIGELDAIKQVQFLQYFYSAEYRCSPDIGVTRQRHVP